MQVGVGVLDYYCSKESMPRCTRALEGLSDSAPGQYQAIVNLIVPFSKVFYAVSSFSSKLCDKVTFVIR